MKIPTRVIYSIRLMIYLADNADRDEPIKLKEVAESQNLPFKYLEQLVMALKNAGLIKSIQGKQGGYTLTMPASEIKALDIIEASIGPIELMDCVSSETKCKFKDYCTSRKMWGLINVQLTDTLSEYTLEDLSEKRMKERFREINDSNDDISISCD